MSSFKVKNIVISGTNMWNPGDDFVRDGVIKILRELFADFQLNFLFYNFNQDFFPQNKFSGISNMAAKNDLDQYRNFIDAVVIAGLSAGTEIKDLYTWVIQNKLHDRVFLIGAGYENSYVERYISEEPEATIFKNARIITGRTRKAPHFISKLNLPYHHINCPALLSVPNVKHVPTGNKISRIGLSLQLPHKQGIPNHCCSQTMYDLSIKILLSLKTKYEVEVIAHHKSEYFHFINFLKKHDIPVIFSSFYQDFFNIYSRYDLMVTTRLHASLFANGFGIPGIIINDTERHTHCLEGFPHSVCVNTGEQFDRAFENLRYRRLCDIATEAKQFKAQLLETYLDTLAGPFGLTRSRPALLHRDRLNVGCGLDYRDGFVNVDGNAQLAKVDHVVEIRPGALLRIFPAGHFRHVLAKDFLEHHAHWEARELLEDFRALLRPGGVLELYLPNTEVIINDPKKDIREKKTWLYGGQDIRQPGESESSDLPRNKYPEYFCHKYGWIPEELREELSTVGFEAIEIEVNDGSWNMHVRALKSKSSSRKPFDAGSAQSAAEYKLDSERKEQALVRQLVQPGMTVFDVGANIGKYSKLFSLLVGESGKVFAFEPDPASARRIEEIALRDNLANVILVEQAVCEYTGKATLNRFPAEHSSWNSLGRTQMEDPLNPKKFVPTLGLVEVETVTLDGFCSAQDISQIDYLKLDVEGGEIRALQGARELLAKRAIRHLQFEVSPKMIEGLNTSAGPVFDLLATYGYECRTITADGRVGDVVKDSSASSENYIAVPGQAAVRQDPVSDMLPVHFFTIVLNGEPFIRHHIEVINQLPFLWHWHIIEGVADLKHDTGWSLQFGGRISDELHCNGLSNDGTTEYLNDLAKQYPEKITIYRKPNGTFWDGKLEMVNAPLSNINEECLLWQVDVDEYWTLEQIRNAHNMFANNPQKTAAYYLCNFFVGPELIITTRDTYGNHTDYEWLRTWRYKPGDQWATHEPPSLCRRDSSSKWIDLAKTEPILHIETEANGLVFNHYAYVTTQQLRFKEVYYGYTNAVKSWNSLQSAQEFPVLLKNYFPWVKDGALVDRPGCDSYDRGNVKRILWIRADSIGDNVMAASMLAHIKAKYSDAKISVLCQDHIVELYESSPFADSVIGFDRLKGYQDEGYRNFVVQKLRAVHADLVLNSLYSRDPLYDLFAVNSGARTSIAFNGNLCNILADVRDKNNKLYTTVITDNEGHKPELERHRDFLAAIEIDGPPLQPIVWITPDDEKYADAFFRKNRLDSEKTIALFVCGQWVGKFYEHYEPALAQIFKDNGMSVLTLGVGADSEINQKIINDFGVKGINLAGKTTLRQTAAILKRCRLGIGADTGSAHIACAVGTPNLVLLGGGHFGRFMPYSPLTSIVCLPLVCYNCNWKCRYDRVHCIKDINPEVIAEAFRQTLEKKSDKPRVFVQGTSLWEAGLQQPKWKWFNAYLDINTVEIIPVGIVPSIPKAANEQYKISQEHITSGNFDEAIIELEKLLDVYPNFAFAHNDLGVIYYNKGDKESALKLYEQAVILNPENINFQKNLADFYFVELGRTEDAIQIYIKVLAAHPDDIEALLAIGKFCVTAGKIEQAKVFLYKVIAIDPDNVQARDALDTLETTLNHGASTAGLVHDKVPDKTSTEKLLIASNLVPFHDEGQLQRQDACISSISALIASGIVPLNICYPDELMEPTGWQVTPVLRRSANVELKIDGKRKPFVTELFDIAATWALQHGLSTFLLTNSDIILTEPLISEVRRLLEIGFETIAISRNEVASIGEDGQLVPGYLEINGYDIFVCRTDWWQQNRCRFQQYIFGERAWDDAYASIMACHSRFAMVYKDGLCFHFKHPTNWIDGHYADYNMGLYAGVDKLYSDRYEAFVKDVIHTEKNLLATETTDILLKKYFTWEQMTKPLHNEQKDRNHFVNICIITYNRIDFTRQCIDALTLNAGYPYVVTVVDNNSQDETREYLKKQKRKGIIKNLVLLDENVGVAKASNLGWSLEPEAEYYLKLDNDIVIVKKNWLSDMVRVIEGIQQAGAVAYNFEPVSYPITYLNNIQVRVKHGILGGACILIPKRTERILGYWCEDYGLYGEEDADYGVRISLSGLMNIYMKDENIGVHLPAGKAAIIDKNTFIANDGIEEKQYAEYRHWKDEIRKSHAEKEGDFQKHILEYQKGTRPLYYSTSFIKGKNEYRKRVSIIIPVHNRLEFTMQCLAAIAQNISQNMYEIIIIDNSSTDGTGEFLKQSAPGESKIISNKENLGFARACNQGAKAASCEYLLFLNNDTEPQKSFLELLLEVLDNDDSVAAAGSKLLYPDGTIQHAGIVVVDDRKNNDHLLARNNHVGAPADVQAANAPYLYQALTAACILIRKSAFKKAGGFDEKYWNGYEDVDLCFKLQEQGGILVYQPASVVIHHESRSGPERFAKARDNISRLHKKWLGKIKPDFILYEDGALTSTDAGKIRPYYTPGIPQPTDINGIHLLSPYAVKSADRPNTGDKDMLPVEQVYEAMQPILLASRPEDAVRALENIARSFPGFARAHSDLGMLYYQSGEKQKAVAHYERAAIISPENADFQKNLADYYYVEMARAEDALKLYSKVLQARPKDVETLMTTGHILVSLQRFEEADAYYRKVLEIEPWNTAANEIHNKLSQRSRGGNGSRKAEDMYAEVKRLLDLNDQAGARRALEKMLGVCPHFALAHNDLAVLCYQSGDKDQALRHYEEAVRLQPENSTFQKNLGDFYYIEQGRIEDALRIYVRILETQPKDIETLMATGHICSSLSRWDDARTFYRRVLEIEPLKMEARKQLDRLENATTGAASLQFAPSAQDMYAEAARLVSAGSVQAGKDRLNELVKLHPGFALGHNDLGVLAYRAEDNQSALLSYQTATRLEPSNLTFQKNLADLYWKELGRIEDALKIYVDIMAAHPEDVETLLATGKICLSLRQPNDARVFFDRVLKIEPWNAEAHQQLRAV